MEVRGLFEKATKWTVQHVQGGFACQPPDYSLY